MQNGKKFMEAALQSAYEGIRKGDGGPFGACIVKRNRIIAIAHNEVLKNKDATAHAEMNAIRKASTKLKSWNLKGCKIYTTTEACPMCFSAIHWAQISEIIYSTAIQDVKKLGFNELSISNIQMKKIGRLSVKIKKNFMRKECMALLEKWRALKGKIY